MRSAGFVPLRFFSTFRIAENPRQAGFVKKSTICFYALL